jgi:hypothetical protein
MLQIAAGLAAGLYVCWLYVVYREARHAEQWSADDPWEREDADAEPEWD